MHTARSRAKLSIDRAATSCKTTTQEYSQPEWRPDTSLDADPPVAVGPDQEHFNPMQCLSSGSDHLFDCFLELQVYYFARNSVHVYPATVL